MALRLGDEAPDFTAETTEGTIRFHEWIGDGWAILFSHPADYTPVCTTELGYTAKLKPEFEKRGVKIIAISVDPLEDHHGWISDINETQNTTINYPLIADPERKVAEAFDMIHPNADDKATVRSVFVIAPDKTIKLTLTYPASTGRNFKDIDVEGCVAGLTVGQDLSERDRQLAGTNAQFNLAKSHRGFAPIGPEVVTLDEFDNPWDLEIRCEWNGVTVQHARTSQLIHDIPSLIVYLSSICELRAGDLVFTGTPSGVGFARTPPEYLEPGDVLTSTIQGIGTLENRCQ